MKSKNVFSGIYGSELFSENNEYIGRKETLPNGITVVVDDSGKTVGEIIDSASGFSADVMEPYDPE